MGWTDRMLSALDLVKYVVPPPVYPENGNNAHNARILATIALLGIILVIVYSAGWVLIMPQFSGRLIYSVVGITCFALTLWLIRVGRVRLANVVFLSISWVVVTVGVYSSGGTRAPLFAAYALIILATPLLSGWGAAVAMTILTCVTGLIMVVLDHEGLVPGLISTPLGGWLTQTTITLMLISTAYFVIRRSRQTLEKAQHELAERLKIETALQESEERFRLTSSVMSDYTFSSRFNAQGDLEHTLLTGAFEAITGYTPEDYNAMGGWRASLYPDDRAQDERDMAALRKNQRVITDVRIFRKDRQIRWVRVYAHPVWNAEQNRLVGINGAVQDITEHRLADDSLRRSEALLRALLNATTDVAFLMSTNGTLLTLNETLARSFGKTVEETIGQNAFDLLTPNLRTERYKHFETVQQTREPMRWEDIGTSGWWDNTVYPVLSASGTVEAFAVFSRDITEHKRLTSEIRRYTEQLEQMVEERTMQLRRAKEQIEIILNNTSDAVALAQPNGDVDARNPAFVAIFGEQVSKTLEHILWTVADHEQVIPVGNALMKVIYDRERQQIETKIIANDGTERDFDLLFIPVKSTGEDDQHGILVSAHNITHLKEIERFKARFIDDALHDLATPIAGLSTRLYLLKRSPEDLDKHMQSLENQVEHLRNLLSDLRTLSELDRQEVFLDLKPCNANQIVTQVFDTYEPVAISKGQYLHMALDQALPEIQLDKRRIERVLVNLMSNAINYTPSGKTITVQTSLQADHLVITVADEGMGIDTKDLSQIFERFYRTDQARRTRSSGTGLGLAIVKEIVELHNGTVTVVSEPMQGTTFTVRLPSNK